ncbi:MAG: CIA30 family protein, partial [Planctomycetota bacterium]
MNKRRVSARVLLTLVSGVILGGLAAEAVANSDANPNEEKTRPKVEILTDFTDPASNQRWQVRNDDVMGGRSIGQMTIDIDTDNKAEPSGI